VRLSVLGSQRAVAIYIATGASFAALGARGLTVPLYAHDIGADRFAVGALFSVSTLAGALLSLPSGVLVDRFGARSLLLVSLVLSGGSQLAIAFTGTVEPMFVWQILGGLGGGAQQAALFAAVTETVERGRLGRAWGWLTLSMQVGFFLGPSIAGIALQWIDIRTDIAVTTGLLVLAIPGCIAAGNTRQSRGGLSLRGPLRALVAQPAFVPVVLGLVSGSLVWGTVGAFLPIFGKDVLGLPGSQVGLLIAVQAVANGASRVPGGWLVDRARRRWPIVLVGTLVWAGAIAVLPQLHGFLLPAILLVVATPFMATAFVAIGVVFGDLSASSTRGVTMGAYGTVLFVGLSIGPLLFGPIVRDYGYSPGFIACAVTAAVLALLMAAFQAEPLWRRRKDPSGRAGGSETQAAAMHPEETP